MQDTGNEEAQQQVRGHLADNVQKGQEEGVHGLLRLQIIGYASLHIGDKSFRGVRGPGDSIHFKVLDFFCRNTIPGRGELFHNKLPV